VEAYLRECVDSVLAQRFRDFEIILVNDCTPDASGEICDSYAACDPRVKVVHLSANRGLSEARNAGMAVAQGRYWVFLDSDDYWQGQILGKVYRILQKNPHLEVVRGRFACVEDGSDQQTVYSIAFSSKIRSGLSFMKEMLTKGLEPSAWLYFFAANLYREHDLRFTAGILAEDYDWLPRFLPYVRSLVCLKDIFYIYRTKRPGSLVNAQKAAYRLAQSHATILDALTADILQQPILREYYSASIPLLLTYIGKMDRADRRKWYQKLPQYHYLLQGNSRKAKALKILIAIFGERHYGYPFYLANSLRIRAKHLINSFLGGNFAH